MTQSYFLFSFFFQNISDDHRCRFCHKSYAEKKHLMAHVRAKHDKKNYSCSKCHKVFGYRSNMTRHEKTCKNQNACIVTAVHICPQCGTRCSTAHGLRRHCQSHNKVSLSKAKDQSRRNANQCKKTAAVTTTPETNTPPHQFRCRRCTDVFDNRRDLYAHGIREHYNQHGEALQPRPWGRNDMAPW